MLTMNLNFQIQEGFQETLLPGLKMHISLKTGLFIILLKSGTHALQKMKTAEDDNKYHP